MKNPVSILGLVLPSILSVLVTLGFRQAIQTNASGEVAAGLIVGGFFSVLLVVALSCIPNLACAIIAAKKKDTLWRLSALGIPLCAVVLVAR